MKCIRFDVCKDGWNERRAGTVRSSMKCIRFDVCKDGWNERRAGTVRSSMKCIRFDVCKQYNALNVTDIPAPQ